MLILQREYHCYNSARVDAGVDAMLNGKLTSLPMPSRLCLDLLNEGLNDQIRAWQEGQVQELMR